MPPNDDRGESYTETVLDREGIREVDRRLITSRYSISGALGSGAMGTVLKCYDRKLERSVALKLSHEHIDSARQRREVKALALFEVDHIVSVYDLYELSDGRLAIAMQFVDGSDLATRIRENSTSIPIEIVKSWMIGVAMGMHAAEQRGIVHRDLKPSNILIDHNECAMVSDFGLARTEFGEQLTETDRFLGTPAYIAPEQVESPHAVDSRADVYSFGATFYHVLVGEIPFKAESLFKLLMKHRTEPVAPPRRKRPDIPPLLSDCIERCMAKNPSDRFQSFGQILNALQGTESDAWAADDDSALAAFETIFRLHRTRFLDATSTSDQHDAVFDFPEGRRLEIVFGDLARFSAEVLVSSDDLHLSMDAGVALALERAAGPGYYESARMLGPVRVGRVAVTPAANLNAKYVFHGITVGAKDGSPVCPSRDIVAEIVDSCFYNAETFEVSSLAFPLLGAGPGHLSREDSLDAMFRVIARRLLHRATTVNKVTIVVREPSP